MNPVCKTGNCAKGFTLIEVLIAMTLLSIMVVLLFASLKICAQSWEQGENKMAEVNEVAVVYNFFQRHLPSATPLFNDFNARPSSRSTDAIGQLVTTSSGQDGEEKTFSFQGKKQSMQFVSVFPASAGRPGMQLFSIELKQQDQESVILVTLTPFFPVTEGESWRKEEVILLKRVTDFTLTYFGVAGQSGESSWQEEWLAKTTQPQLVKINISTANGIFWPEMIIAVKATNPVSNNALTATLGAPL